MSNIQHQGFHFLVSFQYDNGVTNDQKVELFNQSCTSGKLLWGKDTLKGTGAMFLLNEAKYKPRLESKINQWFGSFKSLELTERYIKID